MDDYEEKFEKENVFNLTEEINCNLINVSLDHLISTIITYDFDFCVECFIVKDLQKCTCNGIEDLQPTLTSTQLPSEDKLKWKDFCIMKNKHNKKCCKQLLFGRDRTNLKTN